MECDVIGHRFSRTTNAIRVTPRAKTAKSYMFTLDTPSESSEDELENSEQKKSRGEIDRNESSAAVRFQLDYEHRAEKRNELVNEYQLSARESQREQAAYLKQLQSSLSDEELDKLKSAAETAADLKVPDFRIGGSVVIGNYLQNLQKMPDEVEISKAEKLNLVSTNLHRTLAEHESKLQQLEKRLSDLIAEKQQPSAKQHEDGTSDPKLGGRMLTTSDWLSYGLPRKTLEKGDHTAMIRDIDKIEATDDSNSPPLPYLRSVFLSDLVWDDDGDFEARVDRQLQEYQRMAYKPRSRWSPKITIPQPFNMTIREETKPKHETFASKRFDALREKRDEEEKIQFRANEIPASTMEPKFERLMKAKKQRSEQIRKESKERLMKSERPFSFYKRTASSQRSKRDETSDDYFCI